MLSEAQRQAAEKAIAHKNGEELQRTIALHRYRWAQKDAEQCYLPFRMFYRDEFPEGEIRPHSGYPEDTSMCLDDEPLPPDIGHTESMNTDLHQITADKAEYYFTRLLYLNKKNIDLYDVTDWTGERISEDEARRYRRYYLDRIADYEARPERYDTSPHYRQKGMVNYASDI